MDGEGSVEAVFLRGLSLAIGLRPAVFRKIAIHLKGRNIDTYDGMFGTDFPYFTLDFASLRAALN